MLEIIRVKNPKEKREVFLKEDHLKTSWIVSDLTSKLAFQKEIFKTQSVIPDESLLRAHELWLKFAQRLRGDLKIVSIETAQLLTRKILSDEKEEWVGRPGVVNLVHQYLQALMPILSHKDHHEVMGEFFRKNIESFQKWGHWYFLSKKVFEEFLKEKIILSTWASSILVNEVGFEEAWNKKLIFDLGAQLQPLESELIRHLSKFLDVKVVVPEAPFFGDYVKTLKSYESLLTIKKIEVPEVQKYNNAKFEKYSTQLAEVQDLCVQLRNLITHKEIKCNRIAVAAPDIGVYWPVLYEYLKIEGIPYQRKVQTPIKTFPEISQWLARLKIESGQVDFANLQLAIYGQDADNDLQLKNFEQFQSEFTNIYSIKDLDRNPEIKSQFSLRHQDSEISDEDFLKWAIQFWKPQWSREKLDMLIEKIYSDVPMQVFARHDEWVELLEKFSAKIEVTVDEGMDDGIYCTDLVSLKDLDVDAAILLGLSDKALRKSSAVLISESDVQRLRQDFGYVISEPERIDLEFDVRWNLENQEKEYLLTYAQTDFDGTQLSPSIVWLRGAYLQNNKNDKIPLKIPEKSRWFQIQNSKPEITAQGLLRIENDLGEKQLKWNLKEIVSSPLNLSASQIENYLECPFILASKKMFMLNDLPDLDLDLDAQTRGLLLHKVAELLSKETKSADISEKRLDELFDHAQKDSETRIYDIELWIAQKNRLKKMIQKFICFENEWKQKFPQMIEQITEKNFSIFINEDTGELTDQETQTCLRGRIDRIDLSEDKKHCVVIDYKFDSSKRPNHASWVSRDDLQLALYSLAIEKNILGSKIEVAGAIYYGFKNLNRSRGFLDVNFDGVYFDASSKAKIFTEQKNILFNDVKKILVSTIKQMGEFNFRPEPKDQKSCSQCHWRKVCRAPHLNQ